MLDHFLAASILDRIWGRGWAWAGSLSAALLAFNVMIICLGRWDDGDVTRLEIENTVLLSFVCLHLRNTKAFLPCAIFTPAELQGQSSTHILHWILGTSQWYIFGFFQCRVDEPLCWAPNLHQFLKLRWTLLCLFKYILCCLNSEALLSVSCTSDFEAL